MTERQDARPVKRYEAEKFDVHAVMGGVRVLIRARVFIDGGKVLAVRSLHLYDETNETKPPTVTDGVIERPEGELIHE